MAIADTVKHPIGRLGVTASVDDSGSSTLMFLRDEDGQCVLLLQHELIALRDLLNATNLTYGR